MIYNNYRFEVPEEKMIRVITDTDVKNEADDAFAVVHALLSPRFDNRGFIAAHFGTRIPDGMEKSYQELETIFTKMQMESKNKLFRGAQHSLPNTFTPVDSEGARFLIKEAMAEDKRPLYLLFLGPLTDIASAYLMEPEIAGRITLIWIGGGCYPSGGMEFNLQNDIHAANVVFSSPIPVWQVPKNVYEMMPVSLAELEYRVFPQGIIGRYLFEQLAEHALGEIPRKSVFRSGESWVLGDTPAVGLLLYEHRFEYEWREAPMITQDLQYVPAKFNRPIRVYKRIDSRLLLEDFYCKLALFAQRKEQ
jgi:Inosine-uridine nucleoside N-ribohydrolase